MNFNDHSALAGKHAVLSASSNAWLNYDDDKFFTVIENKLAAAKGSRIHAIAAELIEMKIKLPRTKKTLDAYVNDAIGFRMIPEQLLYYSANAFGTADCIRFHKNLLQISDLKTGVHPASFVQLEVYAAFFCLEYNMKPDDIDIELRIYQNDDMKLHEPKADTILHIMERIVYFDSMIDQMSAQEED